MESKWSDLIHIFLVYFLFLVQPLLNFLFLIVGLQDIVFNLTSNWIVILIAWFFLSKWCHFIIIIIKVLYKAHCSFTRWYIFYKFIVFLCVKRYESSVGYWDIWRTLVIICTRKKNPVNKDTRDLLNKEHVKYNTWKKQCLIATADS